MSAGYKSCTENLGSKMCDEIFHIEDDNEDLKLLITETFMIMVVCFVVMGYAMWRCAQQYAKNLAYMLYAEFVQDFLRGQMAAA